MSDSPSIFSMVSGLGKSFGDSYDAGRKAAQEEETPGLIANYIKAQSGGGGAPAPALGGTFGAMGQIPLAAAQSVAKVPTFATAAGPMGDYLATTRAKESGGNDLAANPNSTAKGRYQFTDGTWSDVAKRHPDLGLTPGGWKDPDQQERAMAAFTGDNAKALTAAGIPINPGNLYVAHFLGEAGGPKFIAGAMSNPDAPAVAFVSPGAARANRSIFFEKDGRPKSAGAVYAERTGRFAGSGPVPTPTLPGGAPPVAVANNEAETQALESRMGMMPIPGQPSVAEADMPAADAQPAQFRVPGQAAPTAAAPVAPQGFAGFGTRTTRSSPEQMAALQAMWKNPNTRPIATQIYGQILKGEDSAWALSTMGDQPVLFNAKTAQIVPVGQAKRSTTTVGNVVVDTNTGQPIYEGQEKDEGTKIAAQVKAREAEVAGRGLDPNDPSLRKYILTGTLPENKEETTDGQIEARRRQAEKQGLQPGTPKFESYVLTGKIGRDQDLSATDKKAIQEADEGVLSAQTAIESLRQAKELSLKAYEGPTASYRAMGMSMFGSEDGIATAELENVVGTNALGQLKSIFGGNPTEGERKILLELQGSVSKPDVVRQKIFDRGIALAEKRLGFNQRRAEELRDGTFYKQDGASGAAKGATVPKGEDRMAIPGGKSAAAALAEAKAAVRGRPDLRPQLQERLRTWGIDPKRLED